MRGYRKKPAWVYAFSLAYLLLPLFTLLQCAIRVDYSAPLVLALLEQDFFILEVIGSVAVAISVLFVSRWSVLAYVVLSLYMILFKSLLIQANFLFGDAFHSYIDFGVILFWIVMPVLFVASRMKLLYFNSDLRWWQQAPRYRFITRGVLICEGQKFPVVSENISSGGVFLHLDEALVPFKKTNSGAENQTGTVLSRSELEQAQQHLILYPQKVGERVRVEMETQTHLPKWPVGSVFTTEAEVAWASRLSSEYPYGVGLKFYLKSNAEKRSARKLVKVLQRNGFPKISR